MLYCIFSSYIIRKSESLLILVKWRPLALVVFITNNLWEPGLCSSAYIDLIFKLLICVLSSNSPAVGQQNHDVLVTFYCQKKFNKRTLSSVVNSL